MSDVGSGPGEGYTINLPVPAGSEKELWLSLVEHIVIPVAESFAPELVLISAGFDAHREDPLAGCRLEAGSFAEMTHHVRELAVSLGVPLGSVLEAATSRLRWRSACGRRLPRSPPMSRRSRRRGRRF